jgi:hypothetical protein
MLWDTVLFTYGYQPYGQDNGTRLGPAHPLHDTLAINDESCA